MDRFFKTRCEIVKVNDRRFTQFLLQSHYIRTLLDDGVNINTTDRDRNTPLHKEGNHIRSNKMSNTCQVIR